MIWSNNCSAVIKEKEVIAARGYRLKYIENRPNLPQKSTSMVKHVVVPDFEPIFGKKIADVFEAVQTPKNPKKPVK